MTHTDQYGEEYCYDDHIENIRVTNIYGYGQTDYRIDGAKDFMLNKIGWENNYSKEGVDTQNLGFCQTKRVSYETSSFDTKKNETDDYVDWKIFDHYNRHPLYR